MRSFGRPIRRTSAYLKQLPRPRKLAPGKPGSPTLLIAPATLSWRQSFRQALLLRLTDSPCKSIEMTLRIDYSNMMISPGGIDQKTWSDAPKQFTTANRGFDALRSGGAVGFVDLPRDTKLLDQASSFASRARGKYDDVVILGIGGSALGPIALRTALRPSGWNMLDEKARDSYPRLQVLDNVDPETITALLGRLRLSRTLFIVTSKSGGTAETMAQFLIVHDRLVRDQLDLSQQLGFVTDPKQGALRPLAERIKVPALDIPSNIGGRVIVLRSAGGRLA